MVQGITCRKSSSKLMASPEQPVKKKQRRVDSDETDFVCVTPNSIPVETKPCSSTYSQFYSSIAKQCLCDIPRTDLAAILRLNQCGDEYALIDWPEKMVLQLLSNLQLTFDVYLKQNRNGAICTTLDSICSSLVTNNHMLVEQILDLSETRNLHISHLASKCISSVFIIAKTHMDNAWLDRIMEYLTSEMIDYLKITFALETIKRVLDWKDLEQHVLEDNPSSSLTIDLPSTSTEQNRTTVCTQIPYHDAESFDTSPIKGLIIKRLEGKWPQVIGKAQYILRHGYHLNNVQAQHCILVFFALWESIISVKANLSIVDVKPFYAHLETFVSMLSQSWPAIIWKQILSLFNEVLCYGSTLALQDLLPEDTCQLAHLIVRYVKDYHLLDILPYRCPDGMTLNNFVGAVHQEAAINGLHAMPNSAAHSATVSASLLSDQQNMTMARSTCDRTLIQKMSLLVLKSIAITVKETRSDSSDSSMGSSSDDYDFSQDMQVITRSIRDVLKKLDTFLKVSLDYHPETPFARIFVHLFSDQDDYMIEAMVCTLDITTGIAPHQGPLDMQSQAPNISSSLHGSLIATSPNFQAMVNPVYSLMEFLKIVHHDSDVLLDYLVSNETCFLLYLLRLLKYIRRNWTAFVEGCLHDSTATMRGTLVRNTELDNAMAVFIRLRMQIERLVARDLFPYNINPVLRLLQMCENLHENGDHS